MKNSNKNYIDNITPVLDLLSEKEIVKAMRNGIRKVARLGVRELKSAYKGTGIKHNANSKYDDPVGGIRSKILKNKVMTKFIIMPESRKKKTSGAFKLRWIEKGTNKRKNDEGWNRGQMRAKPFFSNTIERLKSQIKDLYEKAFVDAINKLIKNMKNKNGRKSC